MPAMAFLELVAS